MKLLQIKPSTRKDKKLMAVFEYPNGKTQTIHFGADGYKDYTIYYKENPKLANEKKKNYIARHSVNENWREPDNPGSLSRWILWNKPSIQESIADFKKRFNI